MESYLEENLWGHYIPGNGTPFEEVGVLGALANPQSTSVKNAQLSSDHLPQDIFLETDDALMSLEPNNFFPLLSASTISFTQNNSNQPQTLPINLTTETAITTDPLTGTITHESELNINPINSTPLAQTQTVAFEPNNSSSVSSPLTFAVKAEGTVTVNSSSSDFDGEPLDPTDDALIYAGKGFTINGNPVLPVQRDSEGNPLVDDSGKPIVVDNAVAVSSNYWYTNTSANYSGLIPPQIVAEQFVVIPTYEQQINQQLEKRLVLEPLPIFFNTSQNPINNANEWYQKFPGGGTSDNPSVIRVTNGGLTVPDQVTLSHTIIIVEQGTINFNGNGQELDNVMLVAENGNINLAQVQGTDIAVFASGTINTNGGAKFGGESVLANNTGDINFNGATKTITEADFLRVVSAGSITYNSSSNTRGEFLSRQNFTFNSSSTLVGSIGAKGNIIFNNGATVIGISSNTDVNIAPTITLENTVSSLEENLDTTNALKVANIIIADDGEGNNSLNLSGEDSDFFEIIDNQLFLKAGVSLDFEEKSVYNVTVSVYDTSIGNGLDDSIAYSLAITDVNLPPTVTLENTVSSLEENLDTTNPQKVANIIIADDGEGNNILNLGGEDADFFEIVGNELFLKAGTILDYEEKSLYNVTVSVDDESIGNGLDDSIAYSLAITNVNLPPTVTLENTVSSLEENLDTTNALKVADIIIADDGEGNNSLNLSGEDSDFFEIIDNQLFLKAGVSLDFETKNSYNVRVEIDDVIIGETPDNFIDYNLTITDVNLPPTVTLENTVSSLEENLDTTNAQKVADIVINDDGEGNNSLNLSGQDADFFEIVGNQLFLKAGTILDYENKPVYDVTVLVDDVEIETSTDAAITYNLTIVDINESPDADPDKLLTVNPNSGENNLNITPPLDPDNDLLTLTIIGIPNSNQGIVKVNNSPVSVNQTLTISELQQLVFIPARGVIGSGGNFSYSVEDPDGERDTQTITFNISPVIILREGENFEVVHSEAIIIPETPSKLRFTYTSLNFDRTDTDFINDGLEVALLDSNGESLVSTIGKDKDAFFNLTEGFSPLLAQGVSVDGQTVTLDLSPLIGQTSATLVFRLINNDQDTGTTVTLRDMAVETAESTNITPPLPPGVSLPSSINKLPSFDQLEDVSNSIQVNYGRTSFQEEAQVLYTDLAVENIGNYPLRDQLLVAVTNLSDPSVSVVGMKGKTPSGLPYFDFSYLIQEGILDPNQTSQTGTISFYNPDKIQFTYDLVVLSQLNQAPVWVSEPEREIKVNHSYNYQLQATDPDGDSLTYKLLASPQGLILDETSQTLIWTPTEEQIGNHNIILEVRDGQGGSSQQSYTLGVFQDIPNRPPLITSTPEVDGFVNTKYDYQVMASDLDGDELSYHLIPSENQLTIPDGMTINETSGLIEWTPNVNQLGQHNFLVEVRDGQGNSTQQSVELNIKAEKNNNAPVIISSAITELYLDSDNYHYLYDVNALDPDEDLLTYTLVESPSEMTIDSNTGQINWQPTTQQIGNHQITVEVTDGRGGIDNQTFVLEVLDIEGGIIQGIVWDDLNANGFRDTEFVQGDNPEIVFVLDISGSTGSSFSGTAVGDINQDGRFNTILDAELASLLALNNQLIELGLGSRAKISLVLFESTARSVDLDINAPGEQLITTPSADNNNNGIIDLEEIVTSIRLGGGTNFKAALDRAIDVFEALETESGDGNLLFFSDGSASNNFEDEVTRLTELGVNLSAFGVGNGASLNLLEKIDPNVQRYTSTDELLDIFNNLEGDVEQFLEPGLEGVTVYLDLNNNGYLDFEEPQYISRIDDPDTLDIDERGQYEFTGLAPGTYTVGIVVPSNREQTYPNSPSSFNVNVSFGDTINKPFGTVSTDIPPLNIDPTITSDVPDDLMVGQTLLHKITAIDENNDPITFTLSLKPDGMAIDPNTGILIWNPTAAQVGEHQVFVKVSDDEGGFDLQGFTIVVTSENTAPVITSTPVTTAGSNSPYQYQIQAQDDQTEGLTFILDNAPDGMSVDGTTGLLTWQPTENQEGTHNVTLRVEDELGANTTQNFTIKVISDRQNDAPILTSTPGGEIKLGRPYLYQIKADDPNGDPLTYTLETAPEGMNISDEGLIYWTPTPTQLGEHKVILHIADGQGGITQLDFTLVVVSQNQYQNQNPLIDTTPNSFNATVGQTYEYNPTASDSDGHQLQWQLINAPDGMSVNSDTGTLRWIPTSEQLGTHDVELQVMDSYGAFRNQTFTLTVRGVNVAPTVTSRPNPVAQVDQLYQYQITASDTEGQSLTYLLQNSPDGLIINPQTGLIQWIPQTTQQGNHTLTVVIEDDDGATTNQTFTLTVEPPSSTGIEAPTILLTPAIIGQSYQYQVLVENDQGQPLTYRLQTAPDGLILNEQTGLIQWTPQSTQEGKQTIVVTVEDETGEITTQTYTVTVADVSTTETKERINPPTIGLNQPPAITSKPVYTGTIGNPYTYTVTAEDINGDTITFRLIKAPQGMTLDPNTGQIQWTNPINGNHTVAVAAIDSQGTGGVQEFTLNIIANAAPIIQSTPVRTASPGQPYGYDLRATDSNADALSYHLITAPDGMTIDELGRVRWTPNGENTGNYPIEIAVTDSRGATVTQSFSLEVVADTLAPMVRVNPSVQPVNLGQSVTLYVRATDNIGVSTLSLTVNGQAVTLDGNGLYTFTPDTVGTIEAIATATDAAGNSQSAITTFEVLDFSDEDAPIINLPAFSDDTVTSPTEIIGTVNDDNLQYYTLEVAKLGSDDFQEVFRGTQAVDNDVLGIFDPTLLENDVYTLRLKAVDAGGNIVFEQRNINVEGDLKLGNFQLSFTDLSIPVSGIPISITRTYDTLTAQERDDFGYGWRLEFRDTNLRTSLGPDDYYDTFDIIGKGFREGDKVYITLPGGKRETFTFKPELDLLGAFLAGAGAGLGLQEDTGLYRPKFISESDSNNALTVRDALLIRTANGDFAGIPANLYNPIDPYFGGQYTLTTGEGIVYEIDALSGDLLTATDTNGNKLTFSESGIISDSGVEVKFLRDAKGRITSIVDPLGNIIQYEYDVNGDLIKVIDREENETKFDYHEEREHYLETIIDPLNREAVRTEYDENGRLSRVIDVNGEGVELVYDPGNSTQTTKDVFGNETIYVYDERGNILTEVDAVGKVTKRTYDQENNLLTETVITEESGEQGYTNTYTYDARGNALTETDPLGNTTYYTYGKFDRVLTETDANGNTTTYDYGFRTGNLLSTKDAQDNINKFSYDNRGNLLSLTDADNNITRFEYDLRGNVTRIIDTNGHETYYTYDDNGNQLTESKTVTTSQGIVNVLTQNTYDKQGNLLSNTDAENNTTYYEYNELNQQIAVIDALGRKTEYRYDDKGQLVETIYPDSTPNNNADNPRNITVYDRGSRQKATIDQGGRVTYYNYDQLGRLIETIYPDEIDTLSQFVSFLDSNETVTTIDWTEVIYPDSNPSYLSDNPRTQTEYYQDGKVKANINERGYRTEYIYDANDQLIEIIYPELADNPGINFTTTNTYDVVGRKIAETDALGRITNYVYDELGTLIKTIFADGTFTTSSYDKLGRRTTTTDEEGKITNYEYDSLGRLTDVVQYLNQNSLNPTEIRTEYGYDELGRLIWVEDANNHKTNYEYDKVGRRTAIELPLGQRSTTTYDAVGNIETVTDFNENIITYFYDEENRLIKKLFADNSSFDYTYTLTGLRETITDSRGTTTYTYDERDRLIAQTDPTGVYLNSGNTLEYSYDLAGNRTSVTTPSGTVYYTFDEWNRLKTVTDVDNHQTIYVYDGVSNLIETTFSNGVIEMRDYDDLNRLIKLENKLGEQVISSYEYTLDKVGNRLKVEEADGRIVEYDYDDLYRLIEETITDSSDTVNDGRVISYTYDAVGNRLTKVDSVEGNTSYIYDTNDRLLESTINDTVTHYQYDDNGNVISQTVNGQTTNYTWDLQNRLIESKTADGDVISYEYNDKNIRVSSTVNGVKTTYLVDSNRPYAQVLEEYEDDNLKVHYVHGLDLISVEKNEEVAIYLVDGLGSTRVLTDLNGNVVATYTYEAFGNLIDSTGDVENNYLFAGEQFDENLEQYYLRDRYYDQGIGRFTRRDTYEGNIHTPVSLHKYLYTNANPVLFVDPTGMITSVGDSSVANAIWDQLVALSNMTSRVVNVLDKVNGVVDAINFLRGITQVITTGQIEPYLEGAALSIATKPNFTIKEAVDSLQENIPRRVLPTALPLWSIWLGKYSKKVNSVLLYLPNPGWLPPLNPVKTGLEIGELPVDIAVLGKKKTGSIIGTGFLAKGVPGADQQQQVWRMDSHRYDGIGAKDITAWPDTPFHYHVVKPLG